jgi:thiosulfate dehydrogenase
MNGKYLHLFAAVSIASITSTLAACSSGGGSDDSDSTAASATQGQSTTNGTTTTADESTTAMGGGYEDANPVDGARLYDEFWAEGDAPEPTDDHPLWASRPDTTSNTRTGADTWRCRECHGWDYRGVEGAYAEGGHATGFPGILDTSLDKDTLFSFLKDSDGENAHAYGEAGLTDDEIWALVKFVLEEAEAPSLVDASGSCMGDATMGETYFTDGITPTAQGCGVDACHGPEGLTVPTGADTDFEDWLGLVASEDPWEFHHKVFYGSAGSGLMPSFIVLGATAQQVADVCAFAQTLPTEPVQ